MTDSISEEQLERVRAWVEGRPHSVEPRRATYADRSDVHALLAAYEQAEARADEEVQAIGAMFSAARDLVCALGIYEGGWNPAREQWAEVTQARDALAEALQPFFAALDEGSDR